MIYYFSYICIVFQKRHKTYSSNSPVESPPHKENKKSKPIYIGVYALSVDFGHSRLGACGEPDRRYDGSALSPCFRVCATC